MINSITFSGRLGKDIQLEKTKNGKSIVRFALAGTAGRKQSKDFITEWVQCTAWDRVADKLATCKKGDTVAVQGKICTDSWEDSFGNKKVSTFINVQSIEISKKQQAEPQYQDTRQGASDNLWTVENDNFMVTDENLPF